ncbi:hypothetical protein EST38_g2434 [Candolleomyces aberdarensis]|uniref:Uncharacterized protein n=1 Tax=Candolleomyces aberdarensis TaxID=2316362 RepID=A0A4Q2DSD2_9AGAR|nr:hypothetical protein EST38_g2434 [Candolleomyces aberdarensis]
MATTASSSSSSTSSIRNDASMDDATGLPTPMSECRSLDDDAAFPMDRFPTPEDESSDDESEPEAEGELEDEGSGHHHSSSPGASTSILASVAKKHKYPVLLPGQKPTGPWLRGLRTELTQELEHLRVETAAAGDGVKNLLYETALLQSRLNKEIKATNKAIETFRSIVDPRWIDFAMQKAEEAVETGMLEDFGDWLADEDEELSEIQDEGKEPKAQETESESSLKRKRDDNESETESDVDAREAEEVELSITVSVPPGKRRKLSGDSNDGYGSSVSAVARGRRRAAALVVSLATTNEDETLVEGSSRAEEQTPADEDDSCGSNVPPPGAQAHVSKTSASSRAPVIVPPRAVVTVGPAASTNGNAVSPTQNTQGTEVVRRRGGRPLRRQYQRIVQDDKGEPIIVDYRHRS